VVPVAGFVVVLLGAGLAAAGFAGAADDGSGTGCIDGVVAAPASPAAGGVVEGVSVASEL
jgi:hypothetical protein